MRELSEDDVTSLLKEIECDIKTALQKHKDDNGMVCMEELMRGVLDKHSHLFVTTTPEFTINLTRNIK